MSANRSCLCAFTFAEHEYINAFGTDYWRRTIRSSFAPSAAPPQSAPQQETRQPALESTLAKV